MIPWRTTAPTNPHPSTFPSPHTSTEFFSQEQHRQQEEEEEAALSISDQRTLYLVNIFIVHTSRFLNQFSALCQEKLAYVHRRMLRLDASLTLLEAQLRSIDGVGEPHREPSESKLLEVVGSSDESLLENSSPL